MPINKTFDKADEEALIEKMEHNLRVKLEELNVNPQLMAYLSQLGFRTVALFQGLGTSAEKVESRAKLFGLDPDKHLEDMLSTAGLVVAWEQLKQFQTIENKDRAEKRVSGQVLPLKDGEYNHAKKTWEGLHKAMPDSRLPGSNIIEQMEADMASREIKALRLNELPSKEEMEAAMRQKKESSGVGVSVVISNNNFQVSQPVRVKLPMPSDTEGIRYRVEMLKAGIEFLKIRHPRHKIWASADDEMWKDHIDHILGEEIMGCVVKTTEGVVVKRPSFELVLHYEYEVRAKAARFMNEGTEENNWIPLSIKEAFKAARNDNKLLQKEFLQKLLLQPGMGKQGGAGRHTPGEEEWVPKGKGKAAKKAAAAEKKRVAASAKAWKAGGKGNGGGGSPNGADVRKGNLKKDGGKKKLHSVTPAPESKPICYGYGKGTCNGCNREHVCQKCFGKHPYTECTA